MADRCIVETQLYGARYFFSGRLDSSRHDIEWVLERGGATEFTEAEARQVVAQFGGVVVRLDQQRTVEGQIVARRGRA